MHILVRGSTILLLLGDLVTFVGSLILTLLVRYQKIPSGDIINQHLGPFFYLFLIWMLVFLIAGLYDRHISLVRRKVPTLVIKVQLINILIAGVFFFALPFGIAPKTNLIIYLIISTILIVIWRLFIFPLITTGKPAKALVIGGSDEAVAIAKVLAKNPYFKNIQPFLLSSDEFTSLETFRSSVLKFVREDGAEMIIADMRDKYASELSKDFYTLVFEDQNIRFFNLSSIYEQLHHRIPPSLIGESWFLENITTRSPHYAYDFLKRLVDVFGALILLLPTIVLSPFVMLAIKLEDKGPVFYVNERIGQFNRPIHVLKFRTMTGRDSGAEALKSALRVTRVGTFMRKTRIDELPQLVNVLRGDLSFIGPRPEIPSLAEVYAKTIPYYNIRHLIKPGLSGWAQINDPNAPRSGVDVERTIDKLSFDLYYLKRRSFLLDIEITLKTINTVLMRSGT